MLTEDSLYITQGRLSTVENRSPSNILRTAYRAPNFFHFTHQHKSPTCGIHMALRSNAMGLRSLSVVAGVDETSTASQPYCHCHLLSTDPPPGGKRRAVSVSSSAADHHNQRVHCQCGEWRQPRLVWTWDTQIGPHHPAVRFEGQHQQHVVFHPVFSSGTSVVRSAEPLLRGAINYFEVKVLTPLTGTDVVSCVAHYKQPESFLWGVTLYLFTNHNCVSMYFDNIDASAFFFV